MNGEGSAHSFGGGDGREVGRPGDVASGVNAGGGSLLTAIDDDVAVRVEFAAELLGEVAAGLGAEVEKERIETQGLAGVELDLPQITAVALNACDAGVDDRDIVVAQRAS